VRAFGDEQSRVRFAHDAIGEKSELLLVRIPVWERNLLWRAFLRLAHESCLELSSRGEDKARREPLQVPFKGRRQGLVEIVDIEDDISLRRGEPPKLTR
jgi:hypothetical protein